MNKVIEAGIELYITFYSKANDIKAIIIAEIVHILPNKLLFKESVASNNFYISLLMATNSL